MLLVIVLAWPSWARGVRCVPTAACFGWNRCRVKYAALNFASASRSGICYSRLRVLRDIRRTSASTCRTCSGTSGSHVHERSSRVLLLPSTGGSYLAVCMALIALLHATRSVVPLALKDLPLPDESFVNDIVCTLFVLVNSIIIDADFVVDVWVNQPMDSIVALGMKGLLSCCTSSLSCSKLSMVTELARIPCARTLYAGILTVALVPSLPSQTPANCLKTSVSAVIALMLRSPVLGARTPLWKAANLEGMKDCVLSALQQMAANRIGRGYFTEATLMLVIFSFPLCSIARSTWDLRLRGLMVLMLVPVCGFLIFKMISHIVWPSIAL